MKKFINIVLAIVIFVVILLQIYVLYVNIYEVTASYNNSNHIHLQRVILNSRVRNKIPYLA